MLTTTTALPAETEISSPIAADFLGPANTPPRSRTAAGGASEASTQGRKRATVPDRSRWESGDNYPGLIFLIPRTPYRVVSDPAGYSWILQKRQGANAWLSWKFFSNRRRLAVVLKELVPAQTYKEIEPQIHALPV